MKFIVANFKMNGSREFIDDYFRRFKGSSQHQIILCPPFPYLERLQLRLSTSTLKEGALPVFLGGQNCSSEKIGAHTGEVSAAMLLDVGCRYVILGHSERRNHQSESSNLIKQKAKEAMNCGLIPIICVGETAQQREIGSTQDIILNQLGASIPEEGRYMIAYEPIWAIGTGKSALPSDIDFVHGMIRTQFPTTPLLYGGSVSSTNITEIFALENVDGVLVGGACLDVDQMNILAEA